MDTPVIAIAQSIWWRNRRSFIVSAATLAVTAALYPLLFAFTRLDWVLAVSTLPLVGVFAVVWNGLLFVEEHGNMSSHYPRFMLTLPVRTLTLVFWPLVLSSTIVALLWMLTAGLVYNASGFALPILMPALGCAAAMVWLQVMSWTPIANEHIRLIVMLLWLSILAALPIYLMTLPHRSPVWFGSLFAVYIAAAFPLGLAALADQRRGNNWRVWPQRLHFQTIGFRRVQRRARRSFGSPAAAQTWYEWNCHGQSVPRYIGIVLLMIVGALLIVRGQDLLWLPPILGLLLGMPVVMAGAAGPALVRFKPMWIKNQNVMSFVAIRPLSSSQIVRAKFVMAAWSALLTWVISLILSLLWILLSGNLDRMFKLAGDILRTYSAQRALVIVALGTVVLFTLVWKQMTDGFAAGLAGRPWIEAAPALIFTAGVIILTWGGLWIVNHPAWLSSLFIVISICLVLGAVIKGAMAIVAFRLVLHRQLMTGRAVTGILGLWLVLTGCGVGLAILLMPTAAPSVPLSWPALVSGIGLFVPLVRFPVATLAVEWNRHR
jgi:hypothetical protein